jgi:hypothetical protein
VELGIEGRDVDVPEEARRSARSLEQAWRARRRPCAGHPGIDDVRSCDQRCAAKVHRVFLASTSGAPVRSRMCWGARMAILHGLPTDGRCGDRARLRWAWGRVTIVTSTAHTSRPGHPCSTRRRALQGPTVFHRWTRDNPSTTCGVGSWRSGEGGPVREDAVPTDRAHALMGAAWVTRGIGLVPSTPRCCTANAEA